MRATIATFWCRGEECEVNGVHMIQRFLEKLNLAISEGFFAYE
jgi:hypothetical protein